MPALASFDYAVIRVVPRVEREEFLNVGVIVFCRTRRYLEACVDLDRARLEAFAPISDLDDVIAFLAGIPRVCRGGPEAGPIGLLSPAERFHWLVAPRSTVVQTSAPHSGLCADPAAALRRLMVELVRIPGRSTDVP